MEYRLQSVTNTLDRSALSAWNKYHRASSDYYHFSSVKVIKPAFHLSGDICFPESMSDFY